MDKRYEVLDGLPIYGEMAVPIVPEGEVFVSEGYVVKFYNDDGTSWIANFPKEFNNFSCVKEFPNSDNLFVIAGGCGYLMNPNYHEPIKEFHYCIEEITKQDNGGYIIATLTDIISFNEYAEQDWREHISFDGIKNLKIENNILSGYCYDIFRNDENNSDMWVKFTFNIDTKELEGGCGSFSAVPEKKPWYRYIWVGSFFLYLYYKLNW